MIKDYTVVAWILEALYLLFKYWYVVSAIILFMSYTFITRCAMNSQRFTHTLKNKAWWGQIS